MKYVSFILLCCVSIGCDNRGEAGRAPSTQPILGSGMISGSVRFVGEAPPMKPINASEPCCQGEPQQFEQTVVVNENGTLRNVFVYLEGAPAWHGSAEPEKLLDQVRCQYVPHAIGIQVGQPLRVRSSDPTMHNVHYVPQLNRARNLAMTQAGEEVKVKFDYAEFVRMKCDVHPWMTAWVGVFDNSFFAVTGDEGSFQIGSVPPGSYKLVAFHELYGRQERSVTISDDMPLQVQFVFGKQG